MSIREESCQMVNQASHFQSQAITAQESPHLLHNRLASSLILEIILQHLTLEKIQHQDLGEMRVSSIAHMNMKEEFYQMDNQLSHSQSQVITVLDILLLLLKYLITLQIFNGAQLKVIDRLYKMEEPQPLSIHNQILTAKTPATATFIFQLQLET